MYPTLHTLIRHVLNATNEIKVQFVLEPLAFTTIKDLSKFHGCAFLEQISYINRTFAFSMHQEYKKILEKIKDNPLLDTLYSNTLLISAQPNQSHSEDPMSLSPALPSQTRPDLPCQQTCARPASRALPARPAAISLWCSCTQHQCTKYYNL